MRFTTSIIAVAAGLAQSALALRVAKSSPCSSKCGNVLDSTTSEDMVCNEGSYASTNGVVFKNCVSCELSSPYETASTEYGNEKETDTQWMIYNVRYATSYCLFGIPDGHAEPDPCLTTTACEPFKDAVSFGELQPNVSTFDYCATWDHEQLPKCLACLRAGDRHFVSNFISVLGAACEQQPVPGKTVSIEGDPFSEDHVNATDPTPIPTLPPDYFKEGPFGLGAKVGVAFGAFAVILLIAGVAVVCTGRRRRKAYLKRYEARHGHKNWTGAVAPPTRDIHDTPLSQRPLRGWDDTPISAVTESTEKGFPRYFSPYSSQYNSPVSAVDGPSMQWPEKAQPQGIPHEIGLALGGDGNSGHFDPPSPIKGKEREAYEMHEVESDHSYGSRHGGQVPAGYGYQYSGHDARMPHEPEPPVLHHPGYGRSSESPPRRYLSDEDVRRGDAL